MNLRRFMYTLFGRGIPHADGTPQPISPYGMTGVVLTPSDQQRPSFDGMRRVEAALTLNVAYWSVTGRQKGGLPQFSQRIFSVDGQAPLSAYQGDIGQVYTQVYKDLAAAGISRMEPTELIIVFLVGVGHVYSPAAIGYALMSGAAPAAGPNTGAGVTLIALASPVFAMALDEVSLYMIVQHETGHMLGLEKLPTIAHADPSMNHVTFMTCCGSDPDYLTDSEWETVKAWGKHPLWTP